MSATPTPPGDESGLIEIPYYSEPEFLLLSGDEKWSLRNRPAGTVAAAYGHENDAIHDELMAHARLGKVAPSVNGTLGVSPAVSMGPL